MLHLFFFTVLLVYVSSNTVLIFSNADANNDDKVVYTDTAKMFSSYSWTVKTTTFNQIANDLTADINLYVQPGGNLDVGEMFSYFSSDDVNALQNYVKNGGKFYGICLGAFLAGRDYFGLYNESVQEKVDFTIAKTPKFFVLNESRELFTEEPPELGKGKPGVANNIYGTFEDSSILSKIVDFGKGKVGLMAAHPEATSSWNKRVTVSDGQGYDVGITFANWLLGDYNTVVPRYNAGLSVGAKIGIAVAVLVAAVIILAAVIIYHPNASQDDMLVDVATIKMFSSYSWITKTTTFNRISVDLTGDIDLYVQPGGSLTVQQIFSKFSQNDTLMIRNYVQNGGKYYGICLGAFLAGPDYFNILPDMETILDKEGYIEAAITEFTTTDGLRKIYTEEPPELGKASVNGIDVLGTFSDGSAMTLIKTFGKGKVGLMAPHPEAVSQWQSKGIQVSDGMAFDLGIKFANHLFDDFSPVQKYNTLTTGAIIGICLGCLAFVLLIVFFVVWRKRSDKMLLKT